MKKYVIITTINKPTEGIRLFLDTDFNVVIVGDEKTPSDYRDLSNVFFLATFNISCVIFKPDREFTIKVS